MRGYLPDSIFKFKVQAAGAKIEAIYDSLLITTSLFSMTLLAHILSTHNLKRFRAPNFTPEAADA